MIVLDKLINMEKLRLNLAALLLVLVSGQVSAQDTLPYKPWASFNGDTLEYLDYNFTRTRWENGRTVSVYKGKKVSDIFKDLELPVQVITNTVFITSSKVGEQIGLFLGVEDLGELRVINSAVDYYLWIEFAEPHLLPEEFTLGAKWTPEMYNAIKDFELEFAFSNYYLHKDKTLRKREYSKAVRARIRRGRILETPEDDRPD
jgi:hypothetical protein